MEEKWGLPINFSVQSYVNSAKSSFGRQLSGSHRDGRSEKVNSGTEMEWNEGSLSS